MSTSTTPTGKRSTDVTNLQVANELWVAGNLYFGSSPSAPPFQPPADRAVVQINSMQDFLDVGTINGSYLDLPETKNYVISGLINLTYPLRITGTSYVTFTADAFAAIIYSGALPTITIQQGSALVDGFWIANFGAGPAIFYDQAVTGGIVRLVRISNCVVQSVAGDAIFVDATAEDLYNLVLNGTLVSGETGSFGVTFEPASNVGSFSVSGCDFRSGAIDFGTAVFKNISVSGGAVRIETGDTAFSGAATSGNINADGFGVITGVALHNLSGGGTALSGIADADARWVIQANGGF